MTSGWVMAKRRNRRVDRGALPSPSHLIGQTAAPFGIREEGAGHAPWAVTREGRGLRGLLRLDSPVEIDTNE